MSAKRIHFWIGRTEAAPKGRKSPAAALKVARCGVRINSAGGAMTTARGAVTCQRCRNFLESDHRRVLARRQGMF